MTAPQKLLRHILEKAVTLDGDLKLPILTAENIQQVYDDLEDGEHADSIQDARSEIREGDEEVKSIAAPCSRHYESKSVASRMSDGSWVGWIYWYGGGKHGEPEAIEWIDGAYDLRVIEEEKTVIVRTFNKA